jgi:hypothetical protein
VLLSSRALLLTVYGRWAVCLLELLLPRSGGRGLDLLATGCGTAQGRAWLGRGLGLGRWTLPAIRRSDVRVNMRCSHTSRTHPGASPTDLGAEVGGAGGPADVVANTRPAESDAGSSRNLVRHTVFSRLSHRDRTAHRFADLRACHQQWVRNIDVLAVWPGRRGSGADRPADPIPSFALRRLDGSHVQSMTWRW